jgi:hypothetical protein
MSRFTTPIIAGLGLFTAVTLSAGPLTPLSYTLNSSPWQYWDDTGSQLTDGLYNAIVPGANLGVPDAYNWVGWLGNNPSITFNFSQVVTVDSLTLSTVRWEPAGVYLPTQVLINSNAFSVNNVFPDTNKAQLTFNGTWTGTTLSLGLTSVGGWTFLDEVTFDGQIGAPSAPPSQSVPDTGTTLAYVVIAAAALGWQAMRSRHTLRRAA